MKRFVFAFVTLLALTTSAQADSCTAVLEKHERGFDYIVQTFTNYDYWNEQAACQESMQECRREMRERRRYNSRGNFTCNVQGRRGDRGQCSFELQTRNGRTLDSFSRNACQAAKDACNRERVRRSRNGQNVRATCVKIGRTTPPRRQVTKSCQVDRLGRRGQYIQTHNAQVTGQRNSGVKQKACRKAMKKCQRNVVRAQYCVQR